MGIIALDYAYTISCCTVLGLDEQLDWEFEIYAVSSDNLYVVIAYNWIGDPRWNWDVYAYLVSLGGGGRAVLDTYVVSGPLGLWRNSNHQIAQSTYDGMVVTAWSEGTNTDLEHLPSFWSFTTDGTTLSVKKCTPFNKGLEALNAIERFYAQCWSISGDRKEIIFTAASVDDDHLWIAIDIETDTLAWTVHTARPADPSFYAQYANICSPRAGTAVEVWFAGYAQTSRFLFRLIGENGVIDEFFDDGTIMRPNGPDGIYFGGAMGWSAPWRYLFWQRMSATKTLWWMPTYNQANDYRNYDQTSMVAIEVVGDTISVSPIGVINTTEVWWNIAVNWDGGIFHTAIPSGYEGEDHRSVVYDIQTGISHLGTPPDGTTNNPILYDGDYNSIGYCGSSAVVVGTWPKYTFQVWGTPLVWPTGHSPSPICKQELVRTFDLSGDGDPTLIGPIADDKTVFRHDETDNSQVVLAKSSAASLGIAGTYSLSGHTHRSAHGGGVVVHMEYRREE